MFPVIGVVGADSSSIERLMVIGKHLDPVEAIEHINREFPCGNRTQGMLRLPENVRNIWVVRNSFELAQCPRYFSEAVPVTVLDLCPDPSLQADQ